MAKPMKQPISSSELSEFLDTQSDFAFELRCLERLSQIGFRCQHGGTYIDPVTKKARQFDLRAQREDGAFVVRWAVECKNLSETCPLLIMCVPRARHESFHELVVSYDPAVAARPSSFDIPAFRKQCKTRRLDSPTSNYAIGDSVGKSVMQVRRGPDNAIVGNDSDVFEKWSQALASAQELADESTEEGQAKRSVFISLILPILVVPDGTLWKVEYDEKGNRTCDPVRVDRCSFYTGRDYWAGSQLQGTTLTISHLEFVTLSGLDRLAASIMNGQKCWFPSAENQDRVRTDERR